MPPIIPAVIGAGASLFASDKAAKAARKQAQAQKDIAQQQIDAAKEAQDLLGKRIDEAISDSEAAELRAKGLISEGTQQRINQLNQSTDGFLGALNRLEDQVKSDELTILEDLATSGAFSRDQLDQGVLDAIGQSAGFQNDAIEAISAFSNAGKAALKSLQFRTGLLTPEEEAQHRKDFAIPEGESPQSSVSRAAEQAAIRRLRASGISQSGFALEDLAQTAAKVETDDLNRLERLAGLGQSSATNIAGLQSDRGSEIAGLQERLSINKASQSQNEADRRRIVQTQSAQSRLGLGKAGANQQLQSGLQIGALQEQKNRDLANLATSSAAQRSNTRLDKASQTQALLGPNAAAAAAPFQEGAANSSLAGDLAAVQGAVSAANTVAKSGLFTPAVQPVNEFVGPPEPLPKANPF